jgi:hypothetical protein
MFNVVVAGVPAVIAHTFAVRTPGAERNAL